LILFFLRDYVKGSNLKKIFKLFIASRLDENEISHLKDIFTAFDQSKDGQISFEELTKGLIQLKSSNFKEEEMFNLFKGIDVDKNGRIDYTEFLASTLQKKNFLKIERLFEAFTMFDKDNTGYITKDNLIKVLKAEKCQEKEIDSYIKAADKNGDGAIDYKEFLEFMGYEENNKN
jgi:calcium-dependent protein kinase